jgi:type IV pilus assembly protein PilV
MKRSQGFTLLEVLISIFLIALGLLGAAALQGYSIKVTQGGQFRAQAVVIGMDIAERIEANNAGAVVGSYVATLPGAGTPPDCITSACSPADIAVYDLSQVQDNLQRQLPSGAITITRSGAGPFVYTVQVAWKERRYKAKTTSAATQETTESFSFTFNRTVYNRAAVL